MLIPRRPSWVDPGGAVAEHSSWVPSRVFDLATPTSPSDAASKAHSARGPAAEVPAVAAVPMVTDWMAAELVADPCSNRTGLQLL
jgi:hypothetical protein